MFEFIRSIDEGWLLCFATSAMCVLGCLLITVDLIYETLFPKFAARHPFHIQENSSFLIASLSLSAGSLIFTSMFKLLPEAQRYYKKTDVPHEWVMRYLLAFYFAGICICGFLNALIHFCTSESVVHCVHGDEEEGHKHGSGRHNHKHNNTNLHEEEEDDGEELHDDHELQAHDESTPLLRPSLATQRKESLLDLSLKKLNIVLHKNKECHGFESFEKCVLMSNFKHNEESDSASSSSSQVDKSTQQVAAPDAIPTAALLSEATSKDRGTGVVSNTTTTAELHYCDLPTPENLLFFQQQFHLQHPPAAAQEYHQDFVFQSPLIPKRATFTGALVDHTHTTDEHDTHDDAIEIEDHTHNKSHSHVGQQHTNQHHHHITTPLSRLLSIGVQTILAISLHKFPEGFIMYSTSQANPSLGLNICLSLLIHNFVEGFTMCLPMYLALHSRWAAVLISGGLGGAAQPGGAALAWLVFRNRDTSGGGNSDDGGAAEKGLQFLFGNLMALTSGFLTIIGFQMFASAMAFGGTQRFVLVWTCVGIGLIGLSYILIGDLDL